MDRPSDTHLTVVTGGADVKARPPSVRTRDQAVRFLEDALEALRQRRMDCDVYIPGRPEATAVAQQKAFRKFLLHVGVVMGETTAFYCSGLVDEVAYDKFYAEALTAMAGRVVGLVGADGVRV